MVVLDVEAVELQNQHTIVNQSLVFRAAVRAMAAE
jgi:hypothetical protein